ncbi:MAG: response regulator transcription factor [Oscillospiraceae bacterium]|nr:response regulator transcription factor [Oscillospiraceae bacterium]
MRSILIVEDESSIRSFVVINLKRAGYNIYEAESGEEALVTLAANPDIRLALLDLMLPGMDGFELCRQIRAANPGMGIIMLTARTQEVDKVTGLMMGADDYVTKPFSPTELIARVDALFRRIGGEDDAERTEIRGGPFTLNTRNRTLTKNGELVKVTQVEYAIMKTFMENPGKALPREEIMSLVWGREDFGDLKIVDVNIRRLRLKIEEDTARPKYINTVWGYGYKWESNFSGGLDSR